MRRPAGDRARAVDADRTNCAHEGSRSTDATRKGQDAFVRGRIDIAEFGHWVRSRYGFS